MPLDTFEDAAAADARDGFVLPETAPVGPDVPGFKVSRPGLTRPALS